MGYDMWTVRGMTADEKETYDAAEAAFRAAVADRDKFPRGSVEAATAQPLVDETFEAMYAADVTYFRLNIFGMSAYCGFMATRGMLCDAQENIDWDAVPDEPDDEKSPEYAAYLAKRDELLSHHPGECPGIPAFKFSSNDGWVVTPAECRAALAAVAAYEGDDSDIGDERRKYWQSWLSYLAFAAEHDGFRVH